MATDNTNLEGTQYFARVLINGYEIPNKSVQSLSIREFVQDTACELDLLFIDNGRFSEGTPIVDGDIVKVILSKDSLETPVEIEFDILGTKIDKKPSPGNSLYFIELIGITHTDNLFGSVSQRAFVGTSNEVIGQLVSEDSKLTYVEEVKANDSQTWFQISINDSNFIKNVIRRSYYRNEDVPLIYCNRSNRFVYTTLKTCMDKKAKFTAINNDLLSMDAGEQDKVIKNLKDSSKSKDILFFKSNYAFNDNMPIMNRTGGYGYDFTYFDGTNFYDQVINFNYAPMTTFINKKKRTSLNYDSVNYNMQNSNVHQNYLLAYNQNKYLLDNMFSNFTTITISPNSKVDLLDKINVKFMKMTPDNTFEIDMVRSGEYLVSGIYHNIQQGGIYTMILILARNGYNLKDDGKVGLVKA